MALVDGAPGADVIFIAHEGFEGVTKPRAVMRGAMVGKTIRVTAWRVDSQDVPADRDAQVAWLYDNWTKIDAWLADEPPTDTQVATSPPDKQTSLVTPSSNR